MSLRSHLLFLMLTIFWFSSAYALTAAGTVIRNQAKLEYRIAEQATVASNSVDFVVQQLLDVSLVSLDSTPVLVNSPDLNRVLSYKVTNLGNGADVFQLTRVDQLAGDQFNPTPSAKPIFLENGLQQGLQLTGPDADIEYIFGINDPQINAGSVQIIYILSDIVGNISQTSKGLSMLKVASKDMPVGVQPGRVVGNAQINGNILERIVGRSKGTDQATASYQVSGLSAKFDKTVTKIVDPKGGNAVMSGSVLHYQLVYDLTGEGLVDALEVIDNLPDNLRYVPESLSVNGNKSNDANLEQQIRSTGVIQLGLGQQQAPFKLVVEFDASVN